MAASMQINGRTRVVVHLAYPSTHLKTPQLYNARCAERNIDSVLVPWQVSSANLEMVMNALRVSESVCGVIVTIPHKEAVARLCDFLAGPAEELRVTNVARKDEANRWHGRTYDGAGFINGLEQEGHQVEGKRVLLVGAGGVSVSIAHALCGAGVRELVIANRTEERARSLMERLQEVYPDTPVATGAANSVGFDIVVNGTSVGMNADDQLPADPSGFAPGVIVAEVIMDPVETSLLREARRAGATIVPGLNMLRGQIDPLIDYLMSADGKHAAA